MPKTKYDGIYQELQSRIFDGTYAYQQTIPSETMLTSEFGCSRNTVRRAIEMLSSEGFVQSVHGKGVIVIYDAEKHSIFSLNRIESFTEASVRNNLDYVTKVLLFAYYVIHDGVNKAEILLWRMLCCVAFNFVWILYDL